MRGRPSCLLFAVVLWGVLGSTGPRCNIHLCPLGEKALGERVAFLLFVCCGVVGCVGSTGPRCKISLCPLEEKTLGERAAFFLFAVLWCGVWGPQAPYVKQICAH